jgi:transcriptional regulator with XRE-family HTH domain
MLNIFNKNFCNMNLTQIGKYIHLKRMEMGLSQEHVAKLAGLSRVTVNQLENGTLKDLGFAKLKTVMDILGMDIDIFKQPAMKSALTVAARNISTSYKHSITPEILSNILRSGTAPECFHPHLMALLDETPLSVVVKAIAEAATAQTPTRKIMKNLHHWAQQWKVHRAVW